MPLNTYPNATAFLADNGAFLEQEEAVNGLLLGLAQGAGAEDDLRLFALHAENRPVFCGLQTPPRNLVIYGQARHMADAARSLTGRLGVATLTIPGVIGPGEATLAFAEAWCEHNGCTPFVAREMGVYQLNELRDVPTPPGNFQQAQKEDAALLAEWMTAFGVEALGEFDPATSRKAAAELISQERLFVWKNGQPVSMAAVGRPTRNGITVYYVYTPPEHRNRGYASACVAEMSRRMLRRGYRFCSLFADFANPTSNKIYRQMGYRLVRDFREVAFR